MMEERDDILTLFDDDGVETDYVVVDGVEYKEKVYLALVEEAHADDEECEFIILRVDNENDEELLSSIDDEDEFNEVMKLLEEKLEEDDYEIEGILDYDDIADNDDSDDSAE